MPLTIKIKRLYPDAKLPSYAHVGDAGMDVFAQDHVTIKPGEWKKISTGISLELPDGHVGLFWDKSGLGANHGLTNLCGVVDAPYRGECFVVLLNVGTKEYTIEKGDKIAQMLIQKIEQPKIQEVEELSDSSRGAGGFGSTGKK